MTRSELHRSAAAALERCAQLLDESTIIREIDEPIARAVETFEPPDYLELAPRALVGAAAQLLSHLYATAFPAGRQLSASQARDEVVALFERAYPARNSSGYCEALADALDPARPGWEAVLAKIPEMLKAQLRQTYLRWAVARCVDLATWPLRCAMAAILLERCRPWLPEHLQHGPPERLAGYIIDLLLIDLATRSHARGTLGAVDDPFR